jgi:hypothetical protein
LSDEKQIIIQERIDEVMSEEFERMIRESSDDPLIKLLLENRISELTLDEIRSLFNR